MQPTKVFIAMPSRSAVASTDRGYLYGRLTKLADRYPVRFVANDSLASRLYDDGRLATLRASALVGSVLGARWPQREHVWSLARVPDAVDVVYAYGQFPRWPTLPGKAASQAPVVWQQTFAPIELDMDFAAWRNGMIVARSEAVRRAAHIVVPSRLSLEHVQALFPFAADKVSVLPYYMPGLEPLDDEALADKMDAPRTKLLFVGKQAKRKGLPELIRAWEALTEETRGRLDVTVVSGFVDGPVSLPSGWHHERYVDDLYRTMGEAHILAFPTLREAYGLVLVEGMGRGAAILTTSAPLQVDIVGHGGGSFASPRDTPALARALTELVHDRARVAAMAQANVTRFRAEYWHEVVGPAHVDVFEANARR